MSTLTKQAKNHKRDWTPEQEEILLTLYGLSGIQYLMDKLGKSADAIKLKHQELTGSYSVREAGGTFSTREIAEVLGVDHVTIINWIKNFGFPAKQLYKLRKDTKRRNYSIDPYKVWEWVENNKERVNFAHVQRGIIIPEPDWLTEEIRKASSQPIKRPRNWTDEEDEIAWSMWQKGKNYREIAKRLNRPEKGTQRRLTVIRKRKEIPHKKTN